MRCDSFTCSRSGSTNRLTWMPPSSSILIVGLSCTALRTTSRPPSVVSSSRRSGTSVTWSGLTVRATLSISWVEAISRFSRVFTTWRRASTARSWMWRRSLRRWTVIPSAPPSSASTAACTGSGSGTRRAWRTVATWSMLTPRRGMRSSIAGSPSLLAQAGLDRVDDRLRQRPHLRFVGTFGHDAEQRLRSGVAHHEPPAAVQGGARPVEMLLDLRDLLDLRALAHADVEQDVPGGLVVQEDHVAALLAPEVGAPALHLLEHVAVPHRRAHERDARLA